MRKLGLLIVVLIVASAAVAVVTLAPAEWRGTALWQPAGDSQAASQLAMLPPAGSAPEPNASLTPPGSGGGEDPAPPGDGSAPPPAGLEPPSTEPPAAEDLVASPTDRAEWLKKLDEWKEQDPRDLIDAKYKDLHKKLTKTSNPDSADYLPETGRVDPLTRVSEVVPDELKPPRAGETDENEFETYLYTSFATEAMQAVTYATEVRNVLQIGLEQIVTMRIRGVMARPASVPVGASFPITVYPQGFAVRVTVSPISASPDEVVISFTASVPGTDVSLTEDRSFIPR